MTQFSVEYEPSVIKALSRMDRGSAAFIYSWIDSHLVGCENPRRWGKPLFYDRKGSWRYRIGDFRLIATIKDRELVILLIEVGNRKDVYCKK